MKNNLFFLTVFFFLLLCPLFGQESVFDINLFPKWIGLEAGLVERFSLIENLESGFLFNAGGSYETEFWGRDSNDSSVSVQSIDDRGDYTVFKWLLGAGFRQGIIYDEENERNQLELIFNYTFRYFANSPELSPSGSLIFTTPRPGASGFIRNSVMWSLVLNKMVEHEWFNTRQGITSALSAELVPGWLAFNNLGGADYMKLYFDITGALPLLEDDDFSIYVISRFLADWAVGEAIPLFALTHVNETGSNGYSLFEEGGIGKDGVFRGINNYRYDSTLKVVGNLDLYFSFPRIIHHYFMPGFSCYFDAASFNSSSGEPELDTFLYSVGGGIFMNFLNLTSVIIYMDYSFNTGEISYHLDMSLPY